MPFEEFGSRGGGQNVHSSTRGLGEVSSKGAFQEARVGDPLCLGASGAWRTRRGLLGREEVGWVPPEERQGAEAQACREAQSAQWTCVYIPG